MGLLGDPSVPEGDKWGWFAQHWRNMRFLFQPGPQYAALLSALVAGGKDYFVYTSNVDGCFQVSGATSLGRRCSQPSSFHVVSPRLQRAGFDPSRIFAVQGDMAQYQCLRPCSRESIFDTEPLIASLLAAADPVTGAVPQASVPRCPRCGGRVFSNINGGAWFLRSPEAAAAATRLLRWLEAGAGSGAPATLILEVGAGFNTPGVTRLPMEALARGEPSYTLVRVNPDADSVPGDLAAVGKAFGLPRGNDAVADIVSSTAEAEAAPLPKTAATAVGAASWKRFFQGLASR